MESVCHRDRAERAMQGQIAVIFALMVVVIAGFAGLAIDIAHARSVAEDAQRAADAGALAGVVYLPNNPSTATSQAAALSAANGFTANCSGGACNVPGAVQISYTATAPTRTLRETITEQVPTTFLKVLGFSSIAVQRSATATYADPIELGAPDHVMGLAIYPTHAVKTCGANVLPDDGINHTNCQSDFPYAQGFWLDLQGPYAGLEYGDAFSPYFQTVNGDQLWDQTNNAAVPGGALIQPCPLSVPNAGANPANPVNPHAPPTTTCTYGGTTGALLANPYYDQLNPATDTVPGYNFVFTVPPKPTGSTVPVLLKILDPYDECNSLKAPDMIAPDGPSYGSSATSVSLPISKVSGGPGTIDQCNASPFWTAPEPTTLQFTVYQPASQLADAVKTPQATKSPDTTSAGPLVTYKASQGFGADKSANGSHDYQWFTFAEYTNTSDRTQYVRINVQSVKNRDGAYGTGGNSFALGICKLDATAGANLGDPGFMSEFEPARANGTQVPSPPGSASGYDSGCADPNISTAGDSYSYGQCADGSVTCYRVNALNAFCQQTVIPADTAGTAGTLILPIAEVGPHFANSDITLRLFDSGDNVGGVNNIVNILGPNTDPAPTDPALRPPGDTNPSGYEKFSLDIGAPANSGYSDKSTSPSPRNNGRGPMPWWGTVPCGADYSADQYPNGDGPVCPKLSDLDTGGGINTGVYAANPTDDGYFANDTWTDFHVHIPSTYSPQSYGGTDTSLNDWWKVLYTVSSSSTHSDVTTWQVESGAAPVHLVSVR